MWLDDSGDYGCCGNDDRMLEGLMREASEHIVVVQPRKMTTKSYDVVHIS